MRGLCVVFVAIECKRFSENSKAVAIEASLVAMKKIGGMPMRIGDFC